MKIQWFIFFSSGSSSIKLKGNPGPQRARCRRALLSSLLQSPLQNRGTFQWTKRVGRSPALQSIRRAALSTAGNRTGLVRHLPEREGYTSILQGVTEATRHTLQPMEQARLFLPHSSSPLPPLPLRSEPPVCPSSLPRPPLGPAPP